MEIQTLDSKIFDSPINIHSKDKISNRNKQQLPFLMLITSILLE
jgi:hypothetical protein